MALEGKSLMILTPMYGGINYVNYFISMQKLARVFAEHNVKWEFTSTFNESLISRGRNRLVDEYIKNWDLTHAVFIDADIGFDPMDLLAMMEMDREIVAAPCARKSIRWDRVQDLCKRSSKNLTNDQLSRVAGDFVFNYEQFDGTRDVRIMEPQEMRNMGTGLMMIQRNVFERFMEFYPDRYYESPEDPAALPGPIWDFFKVGVNPETRKYDSEDYWFCVDSKAFGAQVWMCPWVKTSHMGTYSFVADMPAVAASGSKL